MTVQTTESGALTRLMITTNVMVLLHPSGRTICGWSRQGVLPTIRMPDSNDPIAVTRSRP
jgi:hypothetical protein